MTKATFAPSLKSWLESANAPSSDFPIQNLPFGIFNDDANLAPRPGVAIGDRIVDLSALEHAGLLNAQGTLSSPRLNDFVALGQEAWREVRIALSSPLASNNGTLRDNFDLRGRPACSCRTRRQQCTCCRYSWVHRLLLAKRTCDQRWVDVPRFQERALAKLVRDTDRL